MRFSVAPQIFEQFPNYCVGGVVATGLDNNPAAHPQLYPLLQEAAQLLRRSYATGEAAPGGSNPVTSNRSIAAWREAFKKAGIKPTDYPSSIEALARRALRSEPPPSINPAVDLANTVSLKYLLPLGGHDLDSLTGDFEVRFARAGDIFTPNESDGTVEPVSEGEPVYADQAEVRTRRWVWRQGRHNRVTDNSRNIFFPIDGWLDLNDQQVREAAHLLKNLVSEELGGQCFEFFVDASNPSIEWENGQPVSNQPARPSGSAPTVLSNLKSDRALIDELLTRGIADIVTREELEAKLLSGRQLRVKLGIDPTGPQIHIGRSVSLLKLRDFQRLGHKVVMLFGTFTGQIGDASDKASTRPMLSQETVQSNVATYKEQVSLILDEKEVEWRFNTEWFADMPFKEGIVLMSHFTAAQMLERDTFNQRFEAGKPISLQELIYPLLQGYDSIMLKADVELGGTDQLFNMLAGRTLQRIYGQEPQSVMMNKMINGTDGQKMSTSLGNGIFITEEPKNQYARMLRTIDEQIIEYFETLTRIPLAEVNEMKAAMEQGQNPVRFKKRLAHTVVQMYHGQTAADEAAEAFEREHVRGELPGEMPVFCPPAGVAEMDIRDLLVEAGLAESKKAAARYVEQNGVSIDADKVTDPKARITLRDGMVLKRGNRNFARIRLNS